MIYPTPDGPVGEYVYRTFHIPTQLTGHVMAALDYLVREYYWFEDGTMTVDDAIQAIHRMIDTCRDGMMIGTVVPIVLDTLPDNMLLCDGSVKNRVDYPALYAKIRTEFIIDPDTFFVPDLRGRVIVGAGSGPTLTTRAVGAAGGAETHTLTVGEMPAHTHESHVHGPNVDFEVPGVPDPTAAAIGVPSITGPTGGGGAHNNMQPFGVLDYAIVAK